MLKRNFRWNSNNTILSVVMVVLLFMLIFWVATNIFFLLWKLVPIFLVLTLIINYRILLNYGSMLWRMINNNPLVGVGATVLSIAGLPLVSLFLFVRAILYWRVKQITKDAQPKFTPYEEITEEDDSLELKEMEKSSQSRRSNDTEYDQFFQ